MKKSVIRTSWVIAALLGLAFPVGAALRGHTLAGYVTGLDGAPVEDVIVEVWDMFEIRERGDAITDQEGYYEIEGLHPGEWKVLIYQRGRSKTVRYIRLQGPNNLNELNVQLVDHGRKPMAFGLYLKPGKKVKRRALKRWQRAHRALDSQQYETAVKHLERAIQIDPSFSRAHTEMGIEYQRRGVNSMAELYYLKALDLNPGDPVPKVNLAGLRLIQGRAAEALGLLRDAVRDDELLPRAHLYLGRAQVATERYEAAIPPLMRALELDADGCPEALRYLGSAYLGLERYEDARDAYRRYLELVPGAPEGRLIRGMIQGLEKKIDLDRRGIQPDPWAQSEIQ